MTLYIDTQPTLEWVDSLYNNKAWADIYEIKRTETGRWLLMWTPGNNHYHQTLEAAKAAAQADYERRTAERFVKVEVPEPQAPYYGLYQTDYIKGQHKMYEMIIAAIARAKEK